MMPHVTGRPAGAAARSMRARWRGGVATIVFLCVQLCMPRRADALLDWLDHLSGPGPFRGDEFSLQLLCIGNQPSPQQAVQTLMGAGITQLVSTSAQPAGASLTLQGASGLTPIDIGPFLNLSLSNDLTSAIVKSLQSDTPVSRTQLLQLASSINRAHPTQPVTRPQRNALSASAPADAAWQRARQTLLEAAAPKVRSLPGIGVWSTCHDHPGLVNEGYRLEGRDPWAPQSVGRRHRHPVLTLNGHYRFYTNGSYLFSRTASVNPDYAGGNTIHLHVFEIQPSLPLTGRLDLLDVQAGVGIYRFTSAQTRPGGFQPFSGVILEPVRFDVHVPAWLVDKLVNDKVKDGDKAGRWYWRPLLAWSFHFGLVKFPDGFTPTDFNATGDAARSIPSNEAIFEKGLVLNVGRLFGL